MKAQACLLGNEVAINQYKAYEHHKNKYRWHAHH